MSELYPVIKKVSSFFALPVSHTPADPGDILDKGYRESQPYEDCCVQEYLGL